VSDRRTSLSAYAEWVEVKAALARVRALCDHAADYEQPDFVDAIRVALIEASEPRPWTVPAPTIEGKIS
jgi:hypothetical protein